MGVASSVRIRQASTRDALELVELRRRVVAEERWFISRAGELELELEDMIRLIGGLRDSAEGRLLVARSDGRVVGFLSLRAPPFRRTRHVMKLEIAVQATSRGQGLGRLLMAAGIEWAQGQPTIHKIGLAVFADNTRAIALYEHFGFVSEGLRKREYQMADGTFRDDQLLCLEV